MSCSMPPMLLPAMTMTIGVSEMKTVPIVAMLVCCSGCSLFIQAPPDVSPEVAAQTLPPVHCTTSVGAPVVDGVLGGMAGYSVVYTVSNDAIHPPTDNPGANVAVPVVLGMATAAYLISSAIGYGNVSKCTEIKEAQAREHNK